MAASFRFADGSIGNLTYCTVGSKTSGGERVEVFAQGVGAVTEDFKSVAVKSSTVSGSKKYWADKGYDKQLESSSQVSAVAKPRRSRLWTEPDPRLAACACSMPHAAVRLCRSLCVGRLCRKRASEWHLHCRQFRKNRTVTGPDSLRKRWRFVFCCLLHQSKFLGVRRCRRRDFARTAAGSIAHHRFSSDQSEISAAFQWLQRIKYIRTISAFLFYLPVVLMRVPRYDIIHIFSASYWSYTLWSLPPLVVGRLFGKKTIINYRSGEADDHLTNWRTAIPTSQVGARDHLALWLPGRCVCTVRDEVRSISNILDTGPFIYRKRRKLRPVFLHQPDPERAAV